MTQPGLLTHADANIFWLCEASPADDDTALLSPAEATAYAALRTAKRRHDWLLGRRVAKRLVQASVAARTGQTLALNEIVILSHADGWPQVSLPAAAAAGPLTLSISHSHKRAFCALVWGNRPLGCDLEFIEPRSAGFVADYFTLSEREHLAAATLTDHPTLANAIWSGKEAALKAIRRGLAEDTRLVSCLPGQAAEAGGWRTLSYRWETPARALPPLLGWWRAWDGFVMTLAAGRAES